MNSLLELDGQEPIFSFDKNNNDDDHTSLDPVDPPQLDNILNFDLGSIQDVPLTFTGGVSISPPPRTPPTTNAVTSSSRFAQNEFIYIAGAEASPDATRDGKVVGTAMGFISTSTATTTTSHNKDNGNVNVIYNYLTYPNGTKFLHKTEGVTPITIPASAHYQQHVQIKGNGDDDDTMFALTVLDMDDPSVPSQMCLVQINY